MAKLWRLWRRGNSCFQFRFIFFFYVKHIFACGENESYASTRQNERWEKKIPKLNWRLNFLPFCDGASAIRERPGKSLRAVACIAAEGKEEFIRKSRKKNGTEIGIGTKWRVISSTLRLRSFIRLHNDNVQISWIQNSNWTHTQMPFRLLCAPVSEWESSVWIERVRHDGRHNAQSEFNNIRGYIIAYERKEKYVSYHLDPSERSMPRWPMAQFQRTLDFP